MFTLVLVQQYLIYLFIYLLFTSFLFTSTQAEIPFVITLRFGFKNKSKTTKYDDEPEGKKKDENY